MLRGLQVIAVVNSDYSSAFYEWTLPGCFTCIASFNHHHNSVRWVLLLCCLVTKLGSSVHEILQARVVE